MNAPARLATAAAAAAAVAAATAAIRYAVCGRSSQVFGPSIYRGPGARRSVALTFDDGPSTGTPELLDFLAGQGVRATFFLCGMNALRHPGVVRRIHAEGHEIGNHTFSHARLCPRSGKRIANLNLRSPGNIYREIAETQEILRDLTGQSPRLFRAPYGMRWWGLAAAQRKLHLLGVMWTVIGHDWEWPPERIASYVLGRIRPGGIICLHDGRDIQRHVDLSGMMAAVRVIVPALQEQGYSFETVSSLSLPDSYAPHPLSVAAL